MSPLRIIERSITQDELLQLAREGFGDFVKAVVDLERGVMAVGGELHADGEALLLEHGSSQSDLWGINLYPEKPHAERIEYDSMINIRPSQGNRSRTVEDAGIRARILDLVNRMVV